MSAIYVYDVACPRCDFEGPHLRKEVNPDGMSVVVSCGDNRCCLTWNVAGPEKQVSS